MDARPLLVEVARALRLAKLEAVLIGNAAHTVGLLFGMAAGFTAAKLKTWRRGR